MFAITRQLKSSSRVGAVALSSMRQKHTLPPLAYGHKALEPVVSGEIMELHHTKHHATYVSNLNAAEEQLRGLLCNKDKSNVSGIIAAQSALKFNGGGHINHSIFWTNLSPNGGGQPQGDLLAAIERDFGSFDNFKTQMTAQTVAIQGSGWGWLGYAKEKGRLVITTCANQDPLQATTGLVPLLGIDVWEHAYYLQYKNVRANYVNAIWDIVDWKNVAERFAE